MKLILTALDIEDATLTLRTEYRHHRALDLSRWTPWLRLDTPPSKFGALSTSATCHRPATPKRKKEAERQAVSRRHRMIPSSISPP